MSEQDAVERRVYGAGGKHPLQEYKEYAEQEYEATADEWADWAERMTNAFEAELDAVKNDYERTEQSLQAQRSRLEASQQENERLIAHGANLEDWILNAPEAVVNPSEDWCDEYVRWRSGATEAALEEQESQDEQ